jgi:hypothetical protein
MRFILNPVPLAKPSFELLANGRFGQNHHVEGLQIVCNSYTIFAMRANTHSPNNSITMMCCCMMHSEFRLCRPAARC